jgi:hypothetical protein
MELMTTIIAKIEITNIYVQYLLERDIKKKRQYKIKLENNIRKFIGDPPPHLIGAESRKWIIEETRKQFNIELV